MIVDMILPCFFERERQYSVDMGEGVHYVHMNVTSDVLTMYGQSSGIVKKKLLSPPNGPAGTSNRNRYPLEASG